VYRLRPALSTLGEGRLGHLAAPVSLESFAGAVRQNLPARVVQIVGERERAVQSIAMVCGAGGDFVPDAVRAQADVLLTGEARFHDCLVAKAQGLALILPGHYATERPGVEDLAIRMAGHFPDLHVWASRAEGDP